MITAAECLYPFLIPSEIPGWGGTRETFLEGLHSDHKQRLLEPEGTVEITASTSGLHLRMQSPGEFAEWLGNVNYQPIDPDISGKLSYP